MQFDVANLIMMKINFLAYLKSQYLGQCFFFFAKMSSEIGLLEILSIDKYISRVPKKKI